MSQKETATKAVEILKKHGFQELNGPEKSNLVIAFARKNMVVYGQAFDMVRSSKKIDFSNESDILDNIDKITIYEVKSTNRKIPKNFANYFFDLTTAELLVAQSLKKKFRFVLVNTITKSFIELTLTELFGKAKSIYPKWAIRF